MSFQTGLSGLNSAARDLDVVGNNVANANVIGFKGSRAQFADVMASSLSGGGSGPVGIGTKVTSVAQDFTQGTITVTNNPLDVAISGNGFFRMEQNGAVSYSRNGQFQVDNAGYIVNGANYNLTGYTADVSGVILPSQPAPLRVSTSDLAPTPTSQFDAVFNLDSRKPVITVPFNANDPSTYTNTTASTVYDSLGNPHVLELFFVRSATAGQWDLYGTVDNSATPNVTGLPAALNFSNTGLLTTTMPITGVTFPVTGGAASPLTVSFNFNGATQYGSDFGVTALSQNGFTSGKLAGFNIADDGIIRGRYTNGQTRNLGQVVLSTFVNAQGLNPLGAGQYAETPRSGLPVTGTPGSGTLGSLKAAALEEGNVDLTQALVDLITAQRNYQANAQTIKTNDAVMQTLVNLR
ncbi:MAG: flagellar hook protein FlgE [Rhodocyclaceae bacterium]|jgi:flagellar hook protein FlgE|nr:flagellar hook protein FlgE [Rhodocyclaceae bacterium]MCE2981854.1 flagellar hook protein FlgE [Betaproteobacteria bacterium]MCA3074868.1 flagellar hook protein FlgE [Rhodocyclaceae bacterium]MCA3089745.1 flagellar hook protein FlgE [Rhodocyclaceae bacterium]MCA3094586.1 flagellar hook protein FlgE [Rhodocyclaceae bacterium]